MPWTQKCGKAELKSTPIRLKVLRKGMAETILEVRNLCIDFAAAKNKKLRIVDGISFTIEKGETLGVVGESGCGKSVTAASILGLLPMGLGWVSGGEILLGNRNLAAMTNREMRDIRGKHISMIFQEPMTSLNPVQRIGTQMIEAIGAHKKISKAEALKEAVAMLEKTGIPSPAARIREFPHQLSGGMRQRVMIAMALLTTPELLIADEPTTALDVTIQAQILELLGEIKQRMNTAILLITHDMGVVAGIADRVIVMYAGRIVESAAVYDLFKNPLHPYTEGLLKSLPRSDRDTEELYTIEGTVPPFTDMPRGCRFSTRCDNCVSKCREAEPPQVLRGDHSVWCWEYC
jgi:peptide/nickel transport system ATP-binding protein/oligopeptide transport system ATP-binding protein